ncbi:hypothetical protein BGX27_009096 [Mortierella sp. AM989]|nr:hypothetical protein BGX27_009096 [Mortierella sp. AM989]
MVIAFASNRDESMARGTSRADFWDVESILNRASGPSKPPGETARVDLGSLSGNDSSGNTIGIISGQDLQPSQAENYIIQEIENTSTGGEKIALTLSTEDVPGTWLGITTHGDLVALTNYRESMEYLAKERGPKLSRGKVCGEFLITMVAARDGANLNHSGISSVANDRAEQWIKRRSIGWDEEFEGLNLLVVQNTGEQQCIGGNREGSELTVYSVSEDPNAHHTPPQKTIVPGSVVGISNSIFKRPWNKVNIGVQALERTLNDSITLFGTGPHACLQPQYRSHTGSDASLQPALDDMKELAWLVIEMLTLLRVNTLPYPKDNMDLVSTILGLQERVFIPRIGPSKLGLEYGTRSSTIVLFGRDSRLIVFVEKTWYGPLDNVTGERAEFAPDSSEGLVWFQGLVGQPRQEWKRIEDEELEDLIRIAKEVQISK